MTGTAYRNVLQRLDLVFRQRAGRRYHYGLARMYAERVEILHARYRKAAVGGIAYDFKFNLFPAFERLFDEHLRGEGKCALGKLAEGLLVRADAASESSEGVG